VVCVLTGHGLKDPDSGARLVEPPLEAKATLPAVMEALGWR
jgi:threonine synthase